MSVYDAPVKTLHGEPASLADHKGETLLIVNVASKCGNTPQYTQLEELQRRYEGRGFTVLGFPCNQFGGQEPGTADEIETFCSVNYGVTFPIYEKIEVNGPNRNPLYAELRRSPTLRASARRREVELREVPRLPHRRRWLRDSAPKCFPTHPRSPTPSRRSWPSR